MKRTVLYIFVICFCGCFNKAYSQPQLPSRHYGTLGLPIGTQYQVGFVAGDTIKYLLKQDTVVYNPVLKLIIYDVTIPSRLDNDSTKGAVAGEYYSLFANGKRASPDLIHVYGGVTRTDLTFPPQAVSLSSFSYQTTETGVKLLWRTESQKDVYSWQIYRATQNFAYKLLATIPAEGNTNEPREYSYLDEFAGPARYRLAEVDIYGKETILDSLMVGNVSAHFVTKRLLAQNPFRQKAVINTGRVSIYDIAGRRVAKLENRNNIINWETKNIPAGVYLFVGKVNDKRVIEKGVLVE